MTIAPTQRKTNISGLLALLSPRFNASGGLAIEPLLAGGDMVMGTDEVFTGELAEQIAEHYRGAAQHEADWGTPLGIEWTV